VSQNESKNTCAISVQDKNIIKEFAEKFKFNSNKTYTLADPEIKDDDLFMSFLVGFIDGDGRVAKLHNRQDAHIGIVGHGNSLEVFKKWFVRLFELFPANKSNSLILGGSVPKLDKSGYARGFISNFEVVKQIKIKAMELGLPVMSRKWDCVDMTLVSKYVITSERRIKAKQLRDQGLTRTEIAKELGVCLTATYRYF
jgi:hypothetical protein